MNNIMKELSIEEKAKAYDEAIKRAKNYYCTTDSAADIKLIGLIFPELKESEDERIVKELLAFFRECVHGGHILTNKEYDSWIAWLEKQGEQKPVFEMKTPEESLGIDSDTYNKIVDECVYGEQKPAWNEEDETMLKRVIGFIPQCMTAHGYNEYINWLKELKDRVLPQPKKEWSEEDSRILYNVKAYIGYAAGQRGVKDELFKEANEWLNSLPIGFICNKNYNEDMVTLLISELEQIANDNNAPLQYQAEINWLKSLRPQSTWKPSDEQMDAIDYVKNFDYGGYKDMLVSLYYDLKKLKDE